MINENHIRDCKAGNRRAQRAVYDFLSPKLYSLCRRYIRQPDQIDDVMADAFYAIYTKLDTLQEAAAFVAWAKRITVNTCLQALRRQTSFRLSLEDLKSEPVHPVSANQKVEQKDLLRLVGTLPDGCRTVFNLFAIEGYTHKEIAAMLGTSEGTSKSQLNVARSKLQKLIQVHYYQNETENGNAK